MFQLSQPHTEREKPCKSSKSHKIVFADGINKSPKRDVTKNDFRGD